MTPGALVRSARRRAGLTQGELARRLETTQSAIARLESPDANPTVATLENALAATGHELELTAELDRSGIDETQIIANLRLTPAERLDRFQQAYRNVRKLVEDARLGDE